MANWQTWRTIEEKKKEMEYLKTLRKALQEQKKILKSAKGTGIQPQLEKMFNAPLEELILNNKTQLETIAKELNILRVGIRDQEKRQNEPKINTDTAVYKMYGKQLKDLTKEELNHYQSRKIRAERKAEREKKGA